MLIDANSGYHNLKLHEQPSYFTTLGSQFGSFIYAKLSIWAAPAGHIFKRKTVMTIKEKPNVFGIVDDILVVDYYNDGISQDRTT